MPGRHHRPGRLAGFRVRETVIGFGNDVTGRTGEVAGTATVGGDQVTHATFRISLGSITLNGKAEFLLVLTPAAA